ncbi:MAG: hypothetical protein ACP5OS_00485 [Leptospirillia bacterium]
MKAHIRLRLAPLAHWWRRTHLAPYLESLGGILVVGAFFVYFYGKTSLIFPGLHPFLPIVLLVAGRYGFAPGLFAALTGTGGYYFMLLWQDHFDTMVPGEFSFLWPSAFLFSGMVMGELRDGEGRKFKALYEKYLKTKDSADTSKLELDILTRAKRELEQRIFLEPNAVSDMFDVFRSLERDEIDSIPSSLLSLSTSFLGADSVALYGRRKGVFVRELEAGLLPTPQEIPGDYGPFFHGYEKGEAVALPSHGILPDIEFTGGLRPMSPLGVYPVRAGEDEVRYLLVIWHAPFEKLTPEFFQLSSMIADRASSRLMSLRIQKETRESVSQDDSTGFLRPVFFARRTAEELGKSFRYTVPLSFFEIAFTSPGEGFLDRHAALMAMRTVAKRLLREVDLVGVPPDMSAVWFCLPHTASAGARVVLSKLWEYWKAESDSSQILSGVDLSCRMLVLEEEDRAASLNTFAAMMKRLDGLYEYDPANNVYSGRGFAERVRARLPEKGGLPGLFRISFSAPSLEEVLFLKKDLVARKNHAGRFALSREAEIGVPLSGAALWVFLPNATEAALASLLAAAESSWAEGDLPKLKRGRVTFESLVLGHPSAMSSDLLVSLEEMGQGDDKAPFRPLSEMGPTEPRADAHLPADENSEEISPEREPLLAQGRAGANESPGEEDKEGEGERVRHSSSEQEDALTRALPIHVPAGGSGRGGGSDRPRAGSGRGGAFPEELLMKVESLIREHGAAGMTRREISKNSRGFARLGPESQEALLGVLASEHRIVMVRESPGRGRPRVSYVHAGVSEVRDED